MGNGIGEINPTTGRPWGQEDKAKVNTKTIFDKSDVVDVDESLSAKINLPSEELKIDPIEFEQYAGEKIKDIQLDEDIANFTKYNTQVNTFNDFRNNRALKQSTLEKFNRSIGKMYTIAGTTFLDGTIGTLVGLGTAMSEGRLSGIWDNPFSNAMVDIQEYVEREYPNYYSNAEQATPFYQRMIGGGGGFANFWGDTILKNFGFAMGAMAAGMATAGVADVGLTAGAGRFFGRKAFGTLGKALGKNPKQTLEMLKLGEAALTETGVIAGETVGIADDLKNIAKTQKFISGATEIIGSVSGAIGEGRIEAINSSREYYKKLRDQGLTLEDAESRSLSHGNVVFGLNVALLSIGNYTQYRNAFSGGYRPNRLALSNLRGDARAGYEISKVGPLKAAGKMLKNPVTEGLEEIHQLVAQKGSERYINRRYDPEANETLNSLVGSLIGGMSEAYGSEEGWENFFAGFITGGVGIVNLPKLITQRKLSVEGGVWEDIKNIRSQNKKAESWAKEIDNYIEKGKGVKKLLERTTSELASIQEKDQAAIEGDQFKYKNAENDEIITAALKFEEGGKTEDLISDLETWKQASADEIKNLAKVKEETEEGKAEANEDNPVHDPYKGMEDEQIEKEHRERIDRYIAKIREVHEIARMVDMASGGKISDDLRDKLIHETATIKDTEDRIAYLSGEINEALQSFKYTDAEYFERMGRKAVGTKDVAKDFDINDITQKFVNKKQFDNWRESFFEYVEKRSNIDKEFKMKWESELKQKAADLNKLYERRDEFIESYSKAFQSKAETQKRLAEEKNLLEKEIRDWSLKLQNINITGKENSFLTDNTRSIEVTNPLTGETDNVLVSKSFKVRLPDDSAVKTSTLGKEKDIVVPAEEETEEITEELREGEPLTQEEAERLSGIDEEGYQGQRTEPGLEEAEAEAQEEIEEQEVEVAEEDIVEDEEKEVFEIEDAEFEIKGINAMGNLTMVDQNGVQAYFNVDGTLTYKGETYRNFKFEQVKTIDENIKAKKQQAKLNALAEYLKGAETRYRNTEKSIKDVDNEITRLNNDLKEAIYLEEYTKTGKERTRGADKYAQAIIGIEEQIATLEQKKAHLQNELKNFEELYNSIRADIGLTERDYVDIDETQKIADSKKASVEWGEFMRNVLNVDSIDDIDKVIAGSQEAINLIQEKIDSLKKARDAYKNIDDALLQREILAMSEEELSDYIWKSLEANKTLGETIAKDREIEINRKLKELREVLDDYTKAHVETKKAKTEVKRIEFIEKYYEDLKTRAYNEYMKILGAKFGKVEDKGSKKEKNREEEINEKKETSNPKHVFTGNGTDFLHTAGGNELAKRVSAKVKRWFSFVNKNKKANFIAYSKNNIPKELKNKVKFYEKGDEEDIIIIPIDKNGKPITVKEADKTYIPYASMTTPSFIYPNDSEVSGQDKFSYERVKKQIKSSNPKITEEEIQVEIEAMKNEALEEYEEIRESIINGEPMKFYSDYRTPGYRNQDSQLVNAKGAVFSDEKQINNVYFAAAITPFFRPVPESQPFNTKIGHYYIYKDSNLLTVYEKKISDIDGETDRLVRLFKKLTELTQEDGKSDEAKKIYNHLKTILYFSDDPSNIKYKLSRDIKGNKIYFGLDNITLKDFQENTDKVDLFAEFLGEKFHNISEPSVKASKTKYKVLDVNEENEVFEAKEFQNYKHYLFSDDGSSKFLIFAPPIDQQLSHNKAYSLTNKEQEAKKGAKGGEAADDILSKYEDDEEDDDSGSNSETPKGIDKMIQELGLKVSKKGLDFATSMTRAQAEEIKNRLKTISDEELEALGLEERTAEDLFNKITSALNDTESGITFVDTATDDTDDTDIFGDDMTDEEDEESDTDDDETSSKLDEAFDTRNLDDETVSKIKELIKSKKNKLEESPVVRILNDEDISDDEVLEEVEITIEALEDNEDNYALRVAAVKSKKSKRITDEEINWFKAKFGLSDIQLEKIKGLVDGNKFGKFTKDLKVIFSEIGVEGTLYHEAFHAVSQVFLTDEQREKLYREIKRNKGSIEVFNEETEKFERKKFKDLTDNEVEEFLAEEFRDYMLVGKEKYKFGKVAALKRNLFEKIADFAKGIIDGFRRTADIPGFFETINKKQFTKDDQTATSVAQDFGLTTIVGEKGDEQRINQEEMSALLSDFKYEFNKILFKNKDGVSQVNTDLLSRSIGQTYISLKRKYRGLRKGAKSKLARDSAGKLFNNFEMFADKHMAVLKGIGVDFRIEEFLDEDKKLKDSYQYDTAVSVSQHDITPVAIKLLIAGLPLTDESFTAIKNQDYMTTVVERYVSTMNTLYNNLAGLERYEQMIERIDELSSSVHSLKVVSSWLGGKETDVSQETFSLRSQFVKAFAKNKNKPLLVHIREDNINFIDAVSQGVAGATIEQWKSNVKTGNYSSSKKSVKNVFKMRNGVLQANMYALADVLGWHISEGKTKRLTRKSVDKVPEIEKLAFFGISLPYDYTDDPSLKKAVGEFNRFLSEEVKNIVNNQKDTDNKYIKFDDFFDRNKIAINMEIQELAGALSELNNENIELMYFNADGQREYAVSLNSHLSNTVNRINRGEIPEYLNPFDEKENPNGNLVAKYSNWLKDVIGKDGKISLSLLRGVRTRMGEGHDAANMKSADFEAMTANAVLHGKSPFLRAADRTMEYAFSNFMHNNNFSKKQITDMYLNYLKATLVQNALAFRGEGVFGKASKFKSESLGYFDFLEPAKKTKSAKRDLVKGLESKLTDVLDKKDSISNQDIIDEVEKYVNSNKTTLTRKIDKHVTELTNKTAIRLISSNIFIPDGKGKFTNVGLSDNLFNGVDKINGISSDMGANSAVSQETFMKTAKSLAVNYVFGAFEQTIMFTGDPRHYMAIKDGVFDFSAFHKRTTGAAGTRYNSIVGGDFENKLNEFYKRVDGKTVDRRKIRKLVYKDIEKEVYGKNTSNIADAQGEMTLDEYRDMKLRNADWNVEAELIWQYEQQRFFAQAIERAEKGDENYDPDFFNIKNFEDTFPETEYNGSETIPMHKGVEITEYDFETALEPIKPQGFTGMEDNEGFGGSYVPQFSKLSIVPIIPSDLNEELQGRLAKMMSNGADMGVFESGEKAEHGVKVDYNLSNPGEITDAVQLHDYSGIGIQLDVDPSGKEKVVYSTQNGRLITVDDLTNALVESFKDARSSIVKISKRKLLNGLGLKRNARTNKLSFIDSEKGSKSRKKFRNKIIESFKKREMPMNLVEGLDDLLKNADDINFDTLISKRQIESILHSLVRKKIIKTTVAGDALVQQSEVRYGEDLAFYRREEDGSIAMMEVMVALPEKIYKSEWYRNLIYKGERGLTAINMMLEDDRKNKKKKNWKQLLPDSIKEFAGGRIPGSELNSLDYVKIKKFLSYQSGPTVVVPAELLVKNGSDFDVDKMVAYYYNYYVGENGIREVNEYNSVKEFWEENKNSIIKKEDKEFFDKNIAPVNKEYKDAIKSSKKRSNMDKTWEAMKLAKKLGVVNRKTHKQLEEEFDALRKEFLEEKKKLAEERDSKLEDHYESFFKKNLESYKLEDFISTEKYENKLVELQKKAISNPERFEELISPTEATTLKGLAKDPEDIVTATDLFTWTRNADVAKGNFTGISGVSLAAIQTISHASTQIQNIEMEDEMFSINIEGYDRKVGDKERYFLGHKETSKKGQRISKLFGEFLNAFVDVAKDDFIARLNAGIEAFPVYAMLIRTGTASGKPMSMEEAVKFLTQPIIVEYLKRRDVEESEINKARNRKSKNREQTIKELFGSNLRYENNSSYKNFEKYLTLSKLGKERVSKGGLKNNLITKDELIGEDINERKWKNDFSTKQMNSQAKILNEFLKLKEYAKQLKLLNDVTRPDADYPSSRAELAMQRKKKEIVLNSGVYSKKNVEDLMEKTYIGALDSVHEESKSYFDDFFITTKVAKIKKKRDDMLVEFLNPKFGLSKTKLGNVARAIEENLITYMVLTGRDNETGEKISDRYADIILTGPNSVPQMLAKAKKDSGINRNRIIKELEPIINEVNSFTKKNIQIDNIKLFSKSNRVEDVNELYSAFQELFEHPEYRDLAIEIAKLALVQSGFSHSYIDFKNVIPETEIRPILEKIIGNGKSFTMTSFYDQFFRNNYTNEDIVPKINKKPSSKTGNLIVSKSHKYHEFPYVSVWIKSKEGAEKQLFKFKNNNDTGDGVYVPVDPLGVPDRFKEYYTEENPVSVIKKEESANVNIKIDPKKPLTNTLLHYLGFKQLKISNRLSYAERKKFALKDRKFHNAVDDLVESPRKLDPKSKTYKDILSKDDLNKLDELKELTDRFDKLNMIVSSIKFRSEDDILEYVESRIEINRMIKDIFNPYIKEKFGMSISTKEIEDINKKELAELEKKPKSDLLSLENFEPITDTPVSDELNNSVFGFLKSIGADVNIVKKIMDNEGRNVNATGIARLWNMTIDLVEGKRGLNSLPEEAAHMYVAMLPREHAIRKALVQNAHKFAVYDRVKNSYQEIYKDAKNPEEMIRLEVAGKLIAEEMKSIDQGTDFVPERANVIQRLLRSLLRYLGIKVKDSMRRPLIKTAEAIMQNDLRDLMDKPDPEMVEMFGSGYTRDRLKWLSESEQSRREYGPRVKYSKGQQKANVSESNKKEVKKEIETETKQELSGIDAMKKEVFDNFAKYFHEYRNYSDEDKMTFIDGMNEGELEIYC